MMVDNTVNLCCVKVEQIYSSNLLIIPSVRTNLDNKYNELVVLPNDFSKQRFKCNMFELSNFREQSYGPHSNQQ
jgi:hypothetical protein